MIDLKKVDDSTLDMARSFLEAVPSIASIDDDILKNAIIATDNDKMIGCLSYEEFDTKGLIRYFVFKKMLDDSIIDRLFMKLEETATDAGIKELVSIVADSQIEVLFTSLGFKELDKTNLYLDEDLVLKTNFRKSNFMQKYLA